jgi:hypothetical protein
MADGIEEARKAIGAAIMDAFDEAGAFTSDAKWGRCWVDGSFEMKRLVDAFLVELRKTRTLVPNEPTDAMLAAALSTYIDDDGGTHYVTRDDLCTFYAAMLSASPAEGGE